MQEKRNFCFETVFTHESKIQFLADAKSFGYEVILVFIHLDQVGLNKARVNQRLVDGGHSVPENKIERRIPRALKHVKAALPLCDQVLIYDNSSAEKPYKIVSRIKQGSVEVLRSPLATWLEQLLT